MPVFNINNQPWKDDACDDGYRNDNDKAIQHGYTNIGMKNNC